MGDRLCILRNFNGTWKGMYTHWGATCFSEDLLTAINKQQEFDLRQCIEKHIEQERQKSGEDFKEVDPYEYIDLSNIQIEAWVIDNGKRMYVVLPFINNVIHGAIVAEVFNSQEDVRTVKAYEKVSNWVHMLVESIEEGMLDKDEAVSLIKRFFKKAWYYQDTFRHLVIGQKLSKELLDTILYTPHLKCVDVSLSVESKHWGIVAERKCKGFFERITINTTHSFLLAEIEVLRVLEGSPASRLTKRVDVDVAREFCSDIRSKLDQAKDGTRDVLKIFDKVQAFAMEHMGFAIEPLNEAFP